MGPHGSHAERLGAEWLGALQDNDVDLMMSVVREARFLRNQFDMAFYLFANTISECLHEILQFQLSGQDWRR